MPNVSDLPAGFPAPWERCLNAFLLNQGRQGASAAELRLYRRTITAFLASVEKPITEVNVKDINGFSPAWARKRKHTTLAHAMLREFFAFSATYPFADPQIPLPPVAQPRKPVKPPKPTPQPAFMTAEENDAWSRCYQQFILTRRSERTRESYRILLAKFFIDSRKPDDYSREEVLMFIHAAPAKRGGAPALNTVNQRLTAISSFYKFSSSYTVTTPDGPQVLLQRPSPTLGLSIMTSTPHPHGLSETELKRLFSVIPQNDVVGLRNFAFLWTTFLTARRRSEMIRLTYGDIEPFTFTDGGKSRQGYRYRYLGKGKSDFQWAELPGAAFAVIDKYLVASGRKDTIAPGDPLFVSTVPTKSGPPGIKPLDGRSVDYFLKRYAKEAGLDPQRVTLHSLRHASAQMRYVASGNDLLEVMRILGHSSPQCTYRYLLALMGQADPVAAQLEAKFSDLLGK